MVSYLLLFILFIVLSREGDIVFRKVHIMTRMDRSSGSIRGHFPVNLNAKQPRSLMEKERQAIKASLQLLIRQAQDIDERGCVLHLKFALAALMATED